MCELIAGRDYIDDMGPEYDDGAVGAVEFVVVVVVGYAVVAVDGVEVQARALRSSCLKCSAEPGIDVAG